MIQYHPVWNECRFGTEFSRCCDVGSSLFVETVKSASVRMSDGRSLTGTSLAGETKRPHERWAVPDGSVSGGRNLAILPLHGRVFLGKAKIPLGFAIHLGSRKVSGKWGRGRLDHGIDVLINLSRISLTMHLRQWSCLRHLWNQWFGARFLESADAAGGFRRMSRF